MISQSSLNQNYKKHIDGVRAIAVISVILFHFNPIFFSGGYLGVDIFFVVSGYVITLTIFNRIEKTNKLDLILFYKKRFFRIFPLLIFVILSTFLFYLFFGYLFEINFVTKIALSSIFGISNLFYIYLKNDYFLQDELNPYLHTWSLGIEEQFYFIYPIILFFIFNFILFKKINLKKIKFFIITLVILIIISLFFFVFYRNTFFGNFYSPLSRFWELAVGCCAFFILKIYRPKDFKILNYFFLLIFLIIIFSDNKINNIILTTILTVLFSLNLIILNKGPIYDMLSTKVFTYLGKISYSLYLWHLPVFYFSKIYLSHNMTLLVSPFIVLLLSFLTYNFIENPFRRSIKMQKYFTYFLLIFLTIIFVFVFKIFLRDSDFSNFKNNLNNSFKNISTSLHNYNYFENKYNLGERTAWNINFKNDNINNCENTNSTFVNNKNISIECYKKLDNSKLFILTGDSHATHLYPMLSNSNIKKDFYLQTFEGCPFVKNMYSIGRDKYLNNDFKYIEHCQDFISLETDKYKKFVNFYDDVYLIISSRYTAYPLVGFTLDNNLKKITDIKSVYNLIQKNLDNYVKNLPNINIIFVSPTPEFKYYPYSCFLNYKYCLNNKNEDRNRIKNINNILFSLAKKYDHVNVFDPYDKICNTDNKFCSMYDKKNKILFFKDKDHLTIEGSIYLSKHFDEWYNNNINF